MFVAKSGFGGAEYLLPGLVSEGRKRGLSYQRIAQLSKLRVATPALRDGRQVVRAAGDKPGLLAFSRLMAGTEVLAVFNTSDKPIKAQVSVEIGSVAWKALHGACVATVAAPGSYSVELAPLDYKICVSEGR